MPAARILHIPLSGRDRRHYAAELRKAETAWPRQRPVHTLRRVLFCAKCAKRSERKRRPDLIGLRIRPSDDPSSPAAAVR
jgi:hypothetical protein